MKIRKVEGLYLFAPFKTKLGNSLMWFDGKSANVVRVETEEGVTGYGEAYGFAREKLFQAMKTVFPRLKGCQFESCDDLRKDSSNN